MLSTPVAVLVVAMFSCFKSALRCAHTLSNNGINSSNVVALFRSFICSVVSQDFSAIALAMKLSKVALRGFALCG